MKSINVAIHSTGDGFRDASLETQRIAAGLPEEQVMQLCLITEEMISLFNSITGHVDNAEFRIESEDGLYTFFLSVHQKLGNVQREQLIQSTSTGRNEAHKGFLGTLKEIFVQAMSVGRDIDQYYNGNSYSSQAADLSDEVISSQDWDQYERSVLLSITDEVKISIHGGIVELIASKKF